MSSPHPPAPQRSHSSSHLSSYLPTPSQTPTPLTHAHPQNPDTLAQRTQLGQVKPRAKSFYSESFHYSSLPRPLEDDSDEEEEEEVIKTSPKVEERVAASSAFVVVPTGSQVDVREETAAAAAEKELERIRVFHNTSFNYQSFKPLFDSDDEDSEDEADVVLDREGGLLATPPLVASADNLSGVADLSLEGGKGRLERDVVGGVEV